MLALGTQREASRDMVCQQAPAHEESSQRTGEESAGTDDVVAEVEHSACDVGAAPADTLMGSQAPRGGGGK